MDVGCRLVFENLEKLVKLGGIIREKRSEGLGVMVMYIYTVYDYDDDT